MNGLKKLTYIVLMLFASAVLTECNTSGCLENRNSIPLAGFYSSETGKQISLDSLRVTGLGKTDDTPLIKEGTVATSIYLPMRSSQQQTAWILSYQWKNLSLHGISDTIRFEYSSLPYFESAECGVIYKYDILKLNYTTWLIDSVVLTDSVITNVDIERIKIYFRTGADE